MDWVIQRFQIVFYNLRRLRRAEKYQAAMRKCGPDDKKTVDEMLALMTKEWKETAAERRERKKRSKI
eukprot:11703195-Karenia_brevis.AAC.1